MKTYLLTLTGRVQGVGFRPFIYRLAKQLQLKGEVRNLSGSVEIRLQATPPILEIFKHKLITEAPPLSQPVLQKTIQLSEQHWHDFAIIQSEQTEQADIQDIHLPPDYFTCDDCLKELTNPQAHRYHYPFINCTQCGPRYTIIKSLPYDRPNTSMADFPLCKVCHAEYSNPYDRRFHAQPLACQKCGPSLSFVDQQQKITYMETEQACIQALKKGQIVAVKGIGGYHLLCDAKNSVAIRNLRNRKNRPDKPLAVMFPTQEQIYQYTQPTVEETQQIIQPMRPIVLVNKKPDSELSTLIAPGINEIGVFLPYSPLHHLLLQGFAEPLVATSGNISGEPVLTDNQQATLRLSKIADAFLHHNRPIERPADDSVLRLIAKHPRCLRLGRGMAPFETTLNKTLVEPVLALGGQTKVTLALAWQRRIVISPHISDLDTLRGQQIFQQLITDFQQLYGISAKRILCDAHPSYSSHLWAKRQKHNLPITTILHHHAHAATLVGEYPHINNWLVFTWDGVGYGKDGTLWGGEALFGQPANWQRLAYFRPFHLPGGDKASRQPWRSAAALNWEMDINWQPDINDSELELAFIAWKKRLNSPQTTAVGRLFDAAAAMILGIKQVSFEGQAPMLLEAIAKSEANTAAAIDLPLNLDNNNIYCVDWSPLLAICTDKKVSVAKRAAIFHSSLAKSLLDQALQIKTQYPFDAIGLSGGVFQNRLLSETIFSLAQDKGIPVYLPEKIPVSDGGLSYGQVIDYLVSIQKC